MCPFPKPRRSVDGPAHAIGDNARESRPAQGIVLQHGARVIRGNEGYSGGRVEVHGYHG